MAFEYKTVGGPERGVKRRGCRTAADRVAAAMQELIRIEAAEGWEYLRTDLVPVEERASWLGRKQVIHCAVLVFRRERPEEPESRASLSRKAAAIFGRLGGGGRAARKADAEPTVGPVSGPASGPRGGARMQPKVPLPEPRPAEAAPAPATRYVPAAAPLAPMQLPLPQAADQPRPPTPEQLQAMRPFGHDPAPGPSPFAPPPTALPPTAPPPAASDRPAAGGLFTRMRGGEPPARRAED